MCIDSRVEQLSQSNFNVHEILDRCNERWEKTLKDEVDIRSRSDERILERIQTLTEVVDLQIRTITDSSQKLVNEFEVERRTRQNSDDVLAQRWRELQAEFAGERGHRCRGEGKLANGIEELRKVVVEVVGIAEQQMHKGTVTINQGPSDTGTFTASAATTAAKLAVSIAGQTQSTSPSTTTVQVSNSRGTTFARSISPQPRSREMTLDALAGPVVYTSSQRLDQKNQHTFVPTPVLEYKV